VKGKKVDFKCLVGKGKEFYSNIKNNLLQPKINNGEIFNEKKSCRKAMISSPVVQGFPTFERLENPYAKIICLREQLKSALTSFSGFLQFI
jgi:hypothetical protein